MTECQKFAKNTLATLDASAPEHWAATFVALRIHLQRAYLKGRVLSTLHGARIFQNILDYAGRGNQWEPEIRTEYEATFRALCNEKV